ncbi:hypothetical protein [Epibacterium ulvae]|uniref:hypothetical protein n=1 Tax=Epibacterium ulvae TaxID=1156985 RepID=UPI0024917D1F|nr:hypothetical protein [Epibacterium ulvae]
MARSHWHVLRDEQGLTLCREKPARFDVSVQTVLPDGNPLRYAHQIRQDLWRKLQRVRGFSPVVQLTRGADGSWQARVGGRASGPVPASIVDSIEDLLSDQTRRARWARHAAIATTRQM